MPNKLNLDLVRQIRNELQFTETADLIEIWQTNDRAAWTAEGLAVVHDLLVERLGPIPPQAQSATWAAGLAIRAQHHLERAATLEQQHQYKQALAECQAAVRLAPRLAAAHNLHGLLLEVAGQPLEAVAAYREAVRLDPNFSEARENLREAEHEWQAADQPPLANPAVDDPLLSGEYVVASGDLPEELYLSEAARILPGWPGYRTRPGRSGLDYLDTAYELAHMQGVFVRQIFTGQLRSKNPLALSLLGLWGVLAELPWILGSVELLQGHLAYWGVIILLSVYWVPGLFLLWNVALSLRAWATEK